MGFPHDVEFASASAGWVVLTALNRCLATEGTLIDVVPTLSQWWAEEDQADALIATVCSDVFPSATLLERCVLCDMHTYCLCSSAIVTLLCLFVGTAQSLCFTFRVPWH